MPTDAELIAHVLRRCTFGPTDQQMQRFARSRPTDVVEALLSDEPRAAPPIRLAGGEDDEFDRVLRWWIDRMRSDAGGLTERMVWFWHGHLTSSLDKAQPRLMADQVELLRRHALGNFRTLMHEITLDPAMLYWLDGSGSTAQSPNENYARELMELFTLGRHSGAYTEADVQAGAQALAGWWVHDWNDDDDQPLDEVTVFFEEDDALRGSVTFLGRRVRNAADVVDAVCDHMACAPFVAGKIHEYFVGFPPSDARRTELGDVFRSSDLEIRPVVEAVLRDPAFLSTTGSRPRSPLEWFFGFERLVQIDLEPWMLEELGQLPMHPPNVAGWPDPQRWLAGGSVITKAQIALDHSWDSETLGSDQVAELLRRAGLVDVSSGTLAALEAIARDDEIGRRERASLLHAAVAMSPEFNVI